MFIDHLNETVQSHVKISTTGIGFMGYGFQHLPFLAQSFRQGIWIPPVTTEKPQKPRSPSKKAVSAVYPISANKTAVTSAMDAHPEEMYLAIHIRGVVLHLACGKGVK
jgi:hypothetical protein